MTTTRVLDGLVRNEVTDTAVGHLTQAGEITGGVHLYPPQRDNPVERSRPRGRVWYSTAAIGAAMAMCVVLAATASDRSAPAAGVATTSAPTTTAPATTTSTPVNHVVPVPPQANEPPPRASVETATVTSVQAPPPALALPVAAQGELLVGIAPVASPRAGYPHTCVINGRPYPNSILFSLTASEAARLDYHLPDATRLVATIGLVDVPGGTTAGATVFVQDGGTDQRTGLSPKVLPDTRVSYGRPVELAVAVRSGTPLRIQGSAGSDLVLCVGTPRIERR
ncbi:hypothetical protein [Actinokineospora terrae]|uniref:Uncharacterized protein n=1 Tax=Actinokineospora terrae TaxID=155974 RepID=A0A1H9MH60_9PSEU|nr:hypothetical protein [Actinokineospora terrae]SER22797.1 hypothetical protein SAMN04487818_102150 [Actinokineospora terrae]